MSALWTQVTGGIYPISRKSRCLMVGIGIQTPCLPAELCGGESAAVLMTTHTHNGGKKIFFIIVWVI